MALYFFDATCVLMEMRGDCNSRLSETALEMGYF